MIGLAVTLLLVAGALTASHGNAVPPCQLAMLYEPLATTLRSEYLAPCLRACGVDYGDYAAGLFPSHAQFQRFEAMPACQAFYKQLQTNFLTAPECSIPSAAGPLSTHNLTDVPIETLLTTTYPIAHQNFTRSNATPPADIATTPPIVSLLALAAY
ncbi:hypothetical protein ACHHYP_08881 [Achlya hypogyna]|uniref:Secreted protein n=1 Tax=Achlya hypogyna TaxID=1202772 RepID=A0A0A7CNU2_ACHHY|nr:secreted protein [Achlya hypogyna]OQR87410.1 hypothetical protein ACHHYP_08881 [Achlya hypogyna]